MNQQSKKAIFAALFLSIILIGIFFRLSSLSGLGGGFYESDVFLYYSVITQTIAANGVIPTHLAYSGFQPNTNPYSEGAGLIYLAVAPYYLAMGYLTVYQVMLIMPILFGILEILGVYILTKMLTNDKWVSLLAMFISATLPVAVLRDMAGQWRGESFVVVILLWTFILALKFIEGIRQRKSTGAIELIGTLILLALIYYTWLAGVIEIGIFVLWAVLAAVLLFQKKLGLGKVMIISLVLLAAGWLLAPYALPTFWNYYFTNSPILQSVLEYAGITPIFAFVLFGISILLAPLGIIAYYKLKERTLSTDLIFLSLWSTLIVGAWLMYLHIRWFALIPVPVAIFSALGISWLYQFLANRKLKLAAIVTAGLVIIGMFIMSTNVVAGITPVGAVYGLYQTTAWIQNNTNANATFLTLWDTGSVIEGFGNRQSYTDSVEDGMNFTRIYNFSQFIYATFPNFTYLDKIKPDYVYLRYSWLNATGQLEEEGNITEPYINNTNLYILLKYHKQGVTFIWYNTSFKEVYNNSDGVLYQFNYT